MPNQLTKARLTSLIDKSFIDVHFNPASLVYTVENKSPQTSSSPKKRQFVAQFSGKLTMDLQFDTTSTGDDVRSITAQVAKFMEPSANATHAADEANKKNPTQPAHAVPVLLFEWGSYKFNGIMESFKETIDLFSPEGVALRALVSIGLARQDWVFDEQADFSKPATTSTILPPGSAEEAADKGGDQRATRQLATDNGQESMRFGNGKPLVVNAAARLNPPVAFVSASASAGAGLGASTSASAGFGGNAGGGIGIGGAAGIGFGGGAGVGIGGSGGLAIGGAVSFGASASAGGGITGAGALFGSKASAGVSAGAGAFAGLETARATISTTAQLDPLKMLPATVGADVSAGASASFSLGGSANSSASAGLSADVGVNFRFSDRLRFDFE
jgi:hypothetical protein